MTNTETKQPTDDTHATLEARRAARMAAQNEASARIAAAELAKKNMMAIARDAVQEGRIMDATQIYSEALCYNDHPDSYRHALADALRYVAEGRAPVVGDVLVRSWGYDQTNIDFYLVTRATAKSVWLRSVGKSFVATTDDDRTSDLVMPKYAPEIAFDKTTDKVPRVEIGAYEDRHAVGSYRCSVGHGSARLWDGEPERQTGWAYGH